ncbi:MAG: ABC transporter ATP-binding protein [Desulfobacteraceae bacterium]
MIMETIKLNNIHKAFTLGGETVKALDGVSLAITQGEFIAVMGASGSGKSTLMNIMGCLDQASGGEYFLEGIRVDTMNKNQLADIRNQKIGFVFQGFNLLPRTSALENVELPLLYSRTSRPKMTRDRAVAALEMVGLAHRLDHHPNQLSGGQQQRVAIARALVNDPAIILADEPTGNLDSRTTVDVLSVFQTLNDNGITLILVTHEADVASYAKRIIRMKDGKIQEDRAVEERSFAAVPVSGNPKGKDENQ